MSLPTDTTGDGIYDPTTFVPGGPPGVSAAQLNKIGAGIREAQQKAAAAQTAAAGVVTSVAPNIRTTAFLLGG